MKLTANVHLGGPIDAIVIKKETIHVLGMEKEIIGLYVTASLAAAFFPVNSCFDWNNLKFIRYFCKN